MGLFFANQKKHFLTLYLIGSYGRILTNHGREMSQSMTHINQSESEIGSVISDWSEIIISIMRVFAVAPPAVLGGVGQIHVLVINSDYALHPLPDQDTTRVISILFILHQVATKES